MIQVSNSGYELHHRKGNNGSYQTIYTIIIYTGKANFSFLITDVCV